MIVSAYSQNPKIRFEYDEAGNQVLRTWCISCLSKNSTTQTKEISKLDNDDLYKFFPNDIISYYPNPVKEELFVKWELINENKVLKLDIINLNGQVVKTIDKLENLNYENISFLEYPIGIYFLNLYYTNGEQKSIKIIKK